MADGRVGVVFLAHEQPRYVAAGLGSLTRDSGARLEAVVVDNGSGPEVGRVLDDFEREAAAAGHVVKRLRFDENVGAIRSRNEGLALVESEYVALIDSDCLARTQGWLAKMAAYLDAHADVGVVGPKLVYPWKPHAIQCAGCDVTRSGRVVFRGRGEPRGATEFADERDCPCLISACWLMRTRLWNELGPLDERFNPVQFEDIDWCYRARQAGWRVVYWPGVEMYHFEGTTTTRTPGIEYNSLTARNAVKFKRKWREVIEREGGMPDREVPPWLKDVGWRPIEEVGELETVP
ncbi:MAG: glycosyltransferase family 2 protein [Planctomycetota bacterium]|jgi:GT2 family glycosyltransferase